MQTAVHLRVVLAALCLATGVACTPRAEGPPIVLVVVDTLRRDHVSVYGGKAFTPNIDRLAARGQVFTNAVSSFHQTTMSMGSLFTGRTPSLATGRAETPLAWTRFAWCGMARFAEDGGDDTCVPQGLTTLAERLRDHGYWTAGVVSNALLHRPYGYDQGFDRWVEVGPGEKSGLSSADRARQRTSADVHPRVQELLAERPDDAPLFLYVHYVDVHDWFFFGRKYAEAVVMFDRALGQLFHQLEEAGLFDTATIVLTADHGEMLGEVHPGFEVKRHYGNPSFEPVLRVPLIVAPATAEPGDRLVRSQDLAGLILWIAGIDDRDDDASPDLAPDEVFLTEAHFRTYRRGRWKSTWRRESGEPVLFDLENDPEERRDVAAAEPDVVAAHRRRVDELTNATATERDLGAKPTKEDEERLRALGYVE